MYDMSALYQAESVQDAIRLRLEHPEAQIIAGGTDVLVQMREGKRAGKALISIQGCREMRGVSLDDQENLRIGSLTTFSHITADPLIQRYINVLGEAVDMVGGPQIRNHRRQHLQRRHLRRLRLHPPRLGGHHRDHRQKRCPPGTHQGFLPQGRRRGPAGGGRRDPDRHPDP